MRSRRGAQPVRRLSPAPARALPTAALLILALALGACAAHAGGGAGDPAHPAASAAASTGGARRASTAAASTATSTPTRRRRRHGAARGPIAFAAKALPPLDAPPGAAAVRVPILMYHRIADPAAARSDLERSLTVAPAAFAAQMRWLRAHGYRSVTHRQLYDALAGTGELPGKPVLVTFDDGYVDVLRDALPALRAVGFTAAAYVIMERIDGDDTSFLRMAHLRRLERAGIEIGSHTVSHADLTALSDADALRELRRSRATLEQGLGHPVQWLCYPAGRYDARVERLAQEAGYVLATTTEPGVLQDPDAPLALHRVRIADTTGIAGLAAALG